jgi:hypothetical protein
MRLLLGALCLAAITACVGEVGVYGDEYVGDYPPDGYIATTAQVYFEGRPCYWYGNHWYYRDGGRWRGWAREPVGLQGWREHHAAPVRQFYERGHATYRAAPPVYRAAPAPAGRHR